jgi:hypothetical protein
MAVGVEDESKNIFDTGKRICSELVQFFQFFFVKVQSEERAQKKYGEYF